MAPQGCGRIRRSGRRARRCGKPTSRQSRGPVIRRASRLFGCNIRRCKGGGEGLPVVVGAQTPIWWCTPATFTLQHGLVAQPVERGDHRLRSQRGRGRPRRVDAEPEPPFVASRSRCSRNKLASPSKRGEDLRRAHERLGSGSRRRRAYAASEAAIELEVVSSAAAPAGAGRGARPVRSARARARPGALKSLSRRPPSAVLSGVSL